MGSDGEEAAQVVAWVKELRKFGLAFHEICIVPRRDNVVSALTSAGIKVLELSANREDPESSEEGVRVATMHRIKGLEFKAVALALFAEKPVKLPDSPKAKKDRCLRYVAATRAREHLLVVMSKE